MADFAATVDAWVQETRERAEAVFRLSAERVIEEARKPVARGGRMRVKTGFLRASLLASTSSMPMIRADARPAPGATYEADEGQIKLVIAGASLSDTIYSGFTASYAAAREFGARGQAPDAFVRTAAQQWPQIVNQVVAEARSRAGG